MSLPASRQSSDIKANGDHWRSSKSIDLFKADDGKMNEQSPLLGPRTSEDVGQLPPLQSVLSPGSSGSWNAGEETRQETKSSRYLMLLTVVIGG